MLRSSNPKLADLKALEETECFKESKDIIFYNFKPRNATPEQIEAAIRQCAEENDFQNCEGSLPPCKQSRETKRQQSHLRRLTLFKSGKMFNDGIFEEERGTHKPSALMDITYETEIGAEQYALLGVMAKHDRRARICELCEYCTKNDNNTVTWCKLVKNGTSRKGTFDSLNGVTCQLFEWPKSSFLFFLMNKLLEEKTHYTIWINQDV